MLRRAAKNLLYKSLTRFAGDDHDEVAVRVLAGPARGLRLRIDLIHRGESAYWFGRYDRRILETLAHVVRPGWTVWDAGTYLGYYTVFFARQVGSAGKVLAIEPDVSNLNRTRKNVEMNGFANVHYLNAAVSDHSGNIEFIATGETNSRIPGAWIGRTREEYEGRAIAGVSAVVEAVRLDEVFPARSPFKPDLIKLDIEGAEAAALRGARMLASHHRTRFLVELHNPESDRSLYEFAAECDYQLTSATTAALITRPEQAGGTVLATPTELARSSTA